MSKLTLVRTNVELPDEAKLQIIRDFLFGVIDGLGKDDKAKWRRFWRRVIGLDPGEMMNIMTLLPRSGKHHRFYMGLEHSLFDSQERFDDRDMFRDWLKIGSGWVVWVPGAKGGIVPLPRSISWSKADEDEFCKYFDGVRAFLRSGHAAKYLWPHLGEQERNDFMELIIQEFER